MLRPGPSRISITSGDIEKIKDDLTKRPTTVRNVKANDWFAVQASHQTQNSRPSTWYKGVLRPNPTRRTGQLLSTLTEHSIHHGIPILDTSSDVDVDRSSELDAEDGSTGPATIAFSLAEARNAMDQIFGEPTSPRMQARIERIPLSPSAGDDRNHKAAARVATRHLIERFSHGHDGSHEIPSLPFRASLRVGGSGVDTPYPPHMHRAHEPAQSERRPAAAFLAHPISLDPLAPSFVPRVRFGSADEDDAGNMPWMTRIRQDPRGLRVRAASPAVLDHRTLSTLPQEPLRLQRPFARTQPSFGSRQYTPQEPTAHAGSLQGGNVDHRTGATVPISNNLRGYSPGQASGSGSGQYSVTPPVLPGYSYPHVDPTTAPRVRVSARPQHRIARPTVATNSYSVPNFNHLADGPPHIHARRGSLNWNRGAEASVPEQSREPRGRRIRDRRDTAYGPRSTEQTTDTALPQSFYLNFSPLDQLTTGLRRFSGSSAYRSSRKSSRRGSGSSSSLRPFGGRLLSGSIFYSEDDENHVSPSDDDGEDLSTKAMNAQPHVSPGESAYYSPSSHQPMAEPMVFPCSDPARLVEPQFGQVTDSPAVSSSYTNSTRLSFTTSPALPLATSSPLPMATSGPLRMSPVTSGPTYSIPISSTSVVPMSSSPPMRQNLDVAASSPREFSPPRSPRFRSSPMSPARLGEASTRPTGTPRFRIYDDDLPAAIQPQTPADVSRHHRPASNMPARGSHAFSGARMSPSEHREEISEARPIFEPSTAELTTIPLLSPIHGVRQSRFTPRRRRERQSTSDEQENELDARDIQGLEEERIAWMQRRGEAEGLMRGGNGLDDTPPGEGRLERMLRD